jgi:hypothetical protein
VFYLPFFLVVVDSVTSANVDVETVVGAGISAKRNGSLLTYRFLDVIYPYAVNISVH